MNMLISMHVFSYVFGRICVLLLMEATALYLSLKTRYNEEIHLKVEMFLKRHGTSKPTRYTFSEIKKITRGFKDKLGQDGFGSVYKGELPNGVPMAITMLENSNGEGREFINEVATVGRIHHTNIVRLLGFCSEGTRRAIIYEFMPKDSLEKYIFSGNYIVPREFLAPDKMLDIPQGCNQRILHLDIKPHTILLDYNFNPKISDFGLAKLCARDQSISKKHHYLERNKSDVYSFGMLVLEMVSGRRNSDPSIESQNQVYLPEWIFEKVDGRGTGAYSGSDIKCERKGETAGYRGTLVYSVEPKKPAIDDKGDKHVIGKFAGSADAA